MKRGGSQVGLGGESPFDSGSRSPKARGEKIENVNELKFEITEEEEQILEDHTSDAAFR